MEITPRIVSLAQRENSSALRDVLHTFNEEDNNDSEYTSYLPSFTHFLTQYTSFNSCVIQMLSLPHYVDNKC